MRKILLSFILLFSLGSAATSAARIGSADALGLARKHQTAKPTTCSSADFSRATVTPYNEALYIVNFQQGGWSVVAADDRVSTMVLGYSDSGSLDVNALPEGIASLLKNFADGIKSLDDAGAQKPLQPSYAESSVAPLLGDIAWSQSSPYNALCPEVNGSRALAGCVNIAEGQIMYYHKFPPKGRDSFSYEWNGTTLSADFGKSEYQWDIMKPFYEENENNASSEAVAKFIYDLAISNSSNFGFLTGAVLWGEPMVKYFNYDPSIFMVDRTRCSRQYYEDLLRTELNAGRPVYVQGSNELGGGHAFVCDGYNAEGYFHFNMGGGSGGYFLNGATGWDVRPSILCSIKPFANGTPGLWAGSAKEFYQTEGNTLNCEARGSITSDIKAKIEVALALVNKTTGATQYLIKNTYPASTFFEIQQLVFNDNVADGDYTLYPVCRADNAGWQKICFVDNAADHVDVSIKNGVKTYTNFRTGGSIDDGVELIDGVYYRFSENDATVVSRNALGNSYSGDVQIPSTVVYKDKSYPVTTIGESAFAGSTMNSLTIGANIDVIRFAALKDASISNLMFAPGCKPSTIGDQSFYNCNTPKLAFPEGTKSFGVMSLCDSKASTIDFPASVTYLGSWTIFNEENYLKDVYVHWTEASQFPEYGNTPLNGSYDNVTLHVPKGCIELYRNNDIWSVFGSYADDVQAGINKIDGFDNDTKIIALNGTIRFESLPEGEIAHVYSINGAHLGSYRAGEMLQPGKGVYVVRVAKTSTKVII